MTDCKSQIDFTAGEKNTARFEQGQMINNNKQMMKESRKGTLKINGAGDSNADGQF